MGDARLEIVRALDSFEARPLEGTDFGWLPFFSPDGESIGFYTNNHIAAISLAGGMTRKIVSAADGSGEAEQLSEAEIPSGYATSRSPDGEYVLLSTRRETTGSDVDLFTARDGSVRPLLSSRFEERAAVFSHDGRYIAYVSDHSGQPEVYVQPFPGLDARTQVSTEGGFEPVWSPKGDTLFFRTGGWMMAVAVTTSPTFSAARPEPLFEDVYARRGASGVADYDVSHDGERFVMIRDRAEEGGAQIHVVLHWFDELRAAGPGGVGE